VFEEKKAIEQHKTQLKDHLKPKFKLYQRSETASKTNRIFVADKTYVKEYEIEPHRQAENMRVYKKPSNAFKINRIFVVMKRRVDEKDVKVRRAHLTNKSMKYRNSKTVFGNQRNAKKEIPLVAKKNFKREIKSKLKDVENMLRDVETDTNDLKPAEIKNYLKTWGFPAANISANWKKSQLIKKLKGVLNEKRESLSNKLEISNPNEEKKKKAPTKESKVKDAEPPILLIGRGDNLYLTADGYFVHAPKLKEKTLFIIDHTVNQFVFKGKSYELANICGNKMTYKHLQHSSGVELSFVLSYEEMETDVPHIGEVNLTVDGGKPTTTLFMKIMDQWHERKISESTAKLLQGMKVNYWAPGHRKQLYQMWKQYSEYY
jgi:hypothetical protein